MDIETLVCNDQNCLKFGTAFMYCTFDEEENENNVENATEAASILDK